MNRQALRNQLTAKRTGLDQGQVNSLSLQIAALVWRLPSLARSQRIACYFSINGEVDCAPIIAEAWDRDRQVFLPVLKRGELVFAHFRPESRLLTNRFGIPEPVCRKAEILRPNELDVVLCPLVAFDMRGNRLGMGGGYYDRSFRFVAQRRNWLRPRLVGLGYEFQKTSKIEAYNWDQPLNNAVTEKRIYAF
jgi:5-formyltetrahydrofolate cyclo-ligase